MFLLVLPARTPAPVLLIFAELTEMPLHALMGYMIISAISLVRSGGLTKDSQLEGQTSCRNNPRKSLRASTRPCSSAAMGPARSCNLEDERSLERGLPLTRVGICRAHAELTMSDRACLY